MAERLVVISDMWGTKKGLWITSYLGYLQQYFDIVFYDSQQLANICPTIDSGRNLHNEFVAGGIDTAVAHLLKREREPSHFLGFSTGGTIAWKANLNGLEMKSLYLVSATRVRLEKQKPCCPITLVYGQQDEYRPCMEWAKQMDEGIEIIPNFGHELYSDEKIIKKVCQDLLAGVIKKQFQD